MKRIRYDKKDRKLVSRQVFEINGHLHRAYLEVEDKKGYIGYTVDVEGQPFLMVAKSFTGTSDHKLKIAAKNALMDMGVEFGTEKRNKTSSQGN